MAFPYGPNYPKQFSHLSAAYMSTKFFARLKMISVSLLFKGTIKRFPHLKSFRHLSIYHVREGPYNFIDGQENPPVDSNGFTNILNPATNLTLATVPASGPNEVDKAVLSSKDAYESWSQVSL